MKMTIEWHEGCLRNSRLHLAEVEKTTARAIANRNRLVIQIAEYEQQINEAKRRGVDGFDSERFMKKKADRA